MNEEKLRIAIHKFTSCDGCQLAFINLGEDLLMLSQVVDIVHFAELGAVDPDVRVDVAYVEGSISTPDELGRIKKIRENSDYLITIGACATSGGIQALRNFADKKAWLSAIYPNPKVIEALEHSSAIAKHVEVDLELWGCPVNGQQILDSLRSLTRKAIPVVQRDSVCMECKRQGYPCVLVIKGVPCMGPVTQTGCGALCSGAGRDCYACYGPMDNPNTASLSKQFSKLGLDANRIKRRFLFIDSQAPALRVRANS